MSYLKSIGGRLVRITLEVRDDGARLHDYTHGVSLRIRDGWNESCEMIENTLSVDELRDLRHLIDRAIAYADAKARK